MTALWLALLVACGGESPSAEAAVPDATPDATPDAEVVHIDIASPRTPIAPEHPHMTPCPEGWVETPTPLGGTTCRPFGDAPRHCTGATAQLPGDDACTPIGTACDGFPTDLPPDRPVLYVDAAAPPGGDGTLERPYDDLSAAIYLANAGTVIAVAKGRYDLYHRIPRDLDLVGACASETILVGPSAPRNPEDTFERPSVFNVSNAAHFRVANVTLTGAIGTGIEVDNNASLVLEDSVIDGSFELGVYVWLVSNLTMRNVAIRNLEGDDAIGVDCAQGSTCALSDVSVSDVHGRGVLVDSMSNATLERVALTHLDSAANGGNAIWVRDSALTARELAIADVYAAIFGFRAELDLERIAVQDCVDHGLLVTETTGRLARASFEHLAFAGVSAIERSTLSVEDVVIVDTRLDPLTRSSAFGLSSNTGTRMPVARAWIESTQGIGFAGPSDMEADASDVVIRGTYEANLTEPSVGALLVSGDLTRFEVDDCRFGVGVFAGGHATLTDGAIRDVGPWGEAQGGIAVFAFDRSTLTVDGIEIRRAQTLGLAVSGEGSRLEGTDVTVGDATIVGGTAFGRALEASASGVAELSRVHVENTRDFAIAAGAGGEIHLTDLRVIDTAAQLCGDSSCSDAPAGFALGADDARIDVETFELARAALCGVAVAEGGEVHLSHGVISDMPVGVCIDDPAYDIATLQDDVAYVRNQVTLEAMALTVPTVSLPSF